MYTYIYRVCSMEQGVRRIAEENSTTSSRLDDQSLTLMTRPPCAHATPTEPTPMHTS